MSADDAGEDPTQLIASRRFLVLLAIAAVVGLVVAFAAWCFLELTHNAQTWVYDDLPDDLGFSGTPTWWPLPALLVAGVIVALAIRRLPGNGGHVPANGLNAGVTMPRDLPGVLLAALAGISLGAVVGPEAPLIALGGGLGVLLIHLVRRDAPDEVALVIAASGTFAALTMIFSSPLISAVLLLEAMALGRRMPVVLVPGLMAGAIGSLLAIGMGAWTGLNTSDYAIQVLALPALDRPTAADLAWTIPFAGVVALGTVAVVWIGKAVHRLVVTRLYLLTPLAGLLIAALAIVFAEATDRGVQPVLFSGQELLDPLTANGGSWPTGDVALLLGCKALAWGIALGSFRGGPVFPSLLLGAAAGLVAAELPGFDVTPAVAVGMGAAAVAVLRLPLSAVVLATLLTARSGVGAAPLVIVGVLVAYLVALALERPRAAVPAPAGDAVPSPAATAR